MFTLKVMKNCFLLPLKAKLKISECSSPSKFILKAMLHPKQFYEIQQFCILNLICATKQIGCIISWLCHC